MTGTIMQQEVKRGYCDAKDKGKIVTTIRIDKTEQEFTVEGKLGNLGDAVNIIAELAQ